MVELSLWDAEIEEQHRIAALLDRIYVAVAGVMVLATAFQAAATGGLDPLMAINFVVIALLAGLRALARRGHVRLVSGVTVASLWLCVDVAVYFDGGLASPSMAAYMLILMLAALLLRGRALWAFAGLSVLVVAGILGAELSGALPAPQSTRTPVRTFFVHLIHLLASGVFLSMAVGSLQRARERARRNQQRAAELLEEVVAAKETIERSSLLLAQEKQRADDLLHNVLPQGVASQLKRGIHPIAERFDGATVLFADLVDFTRFAAGTPPEAVVELLNDIFSRFDALADGFGLEKIKTIGDAYMVVSGLPTPRPDHTAAMAEMALAMRDEFRRFAAARGLDLGLRIGFHCGPVVAGVIGRRKFIYDLWGDTVNTASRMESAGVVGEIQTSEAVHEALRGRFRFVARGQVAVKGKGEMAVYLLQGPLAGAAEGAPGAAGPG